MEALKEFEKIPNKNLDNDWPSRPITRIFLYPHTIVMFFIMIRSEKQICIPIFENQHTNDPLLEGGITKFMFSQYNNRRKMQKWMQISLLTYTGKACSPLDESGRHS